MRSALGPLLVAVAVTSTAGGPAVVRAHAASCPRGKARVRIAGKTSCVAAHSVLPAAPAALTAGSFTVGQVLGGRAFAGSVRALPSGRAGRDPLADAPIAPDLAVVAAHVEPFGRKTHAYPGASAGPFALTLPAAGGVIYNEHGITATNNGSSISVDGRADLGDQRGYRGTLDLHGNIPLDRNGQPLASAATLEYGFELAKGSTRTGLRFRLGMDDGLKFDAPCPSAAGDVNATERLNVNVTSSVEHAEGLDYVRSHTTVTENGRWHGTVDDAAKLQRIDFNETLVIDYGRSAAWGPLQLSYASRTTVTASGTVDGPSGAVSIGSFTVDGSADGSGIGSSAFEAGFKANLRDPASLAELKKLVSEAVHSRWERFKAAEKEWQVENACAHIVFDPATKAPLGPGATTTVSGQVLANDGRPSDSRWEAPHLDVGSLRSGLPGSTGAAAPIRFVVVGGGPSGTTTVQLSERATSRGGIASAPWHADGGGWKVVLSGSASTDQQIFATVASNPSSTVTVQLQTIGGVTGYHGSAAIAYSPPQVTPAPGSQCTYAFGGVTGTFDVTIVPSADGSQITATLDPRDTVTATLTCGPATAPIGGAIVSGYYFAHPGLATITVPAGAPSDTPLSWSASFPARTSGALTIHIEPLTS